MNKRIPRKKQLRVINTVIFILMKKKALLKGYSLKNKRAAALSVAKLNAGRSHAHKTQAAIAMEQRAKVAKKSEAAGVYRKFIEEQI